MIAPIYQDLSRKLEAYITEHGITGRLPGVLKLSRELGVHHVTLTKAIRLLEKKGLLSIQGTRGTFVREKTRRNFHVIGFVGVSAEATAREIAFADRNAKLANTGYRIMDISVNRQLVFENPRLLLQFPVDAYVFYGSFFSRGIMKVLQEDEIPVIATINPEFPEINHIGSDHRPAYARVLRLLRNAGCRRIAFLNYLRQDEFKYYISDIRNAFQTELGSGFDPRLFSAYDMFDYYARYGEAYDEAVANDAWRSWRGNPPDALVTTSAFVPFIRAKAPALKIAAFPSYGVRCDCDIAVYEDIPLLLETASRRMLELLAGDTSVVEIRVPFLFKTPRNSRISFDSIWKRTEVKHQISQQTRIVS